MKVIKWKHWCEILLGYQLYRTLYSDQRSDSVRTSFDNVSYFQFQNVHRNPRTRVQSHPPFRFNESALVEPCFNTKHVFFKSSTRFTCHLHRNIRVVRWILANSPLILRWISVFHGTDNTESRTRWTEAGGDALPRCTSDFVIAPLSRGEILCTTTAHVECRVRRIK